MTNGLISTVEQVDDIPLLLAQMNKIQLATLLDKHFPMHGLWKGLGLGHMVEIWLAYILSEGDHRPNHVESWAKGLLITLVTCLARPVRHLGWQVYACNDPALSLEDAVLAYRQEYLIEHGFARYKGKVLGLTPIYLSSTTRIKGLVRLLSIGLRILCLFEFSVREALQLSQEKLSGIYKGNPKRATLRPTAEMMLKVFRGISLVALSINGVRYLEITPLTTIQNKILVLLGLSPTCYTALCQHDAHE